MVQVAPRDNKADPNFKSLDNNNTLVLAEPCLFLDNHIDPNRVNPSPVTTSLVTTSVATPSFGITSLVTPSPVSTALVTTSAVTPFIATPSFGATCATTISHNNVINLAPSNSIRSLVQANSLQDNMASNISHQLAELTSGGAKHPTLEMVLRPDKFPFVVAASQAKAPVGRGVIQFLTVSNIRL